MKTSKHAHVSSEHTESSKQHTEHKEHKEQHKEHGEEAKAEAKSSAEAKPVSEKKIPGATYPIISAIIIIVLLALVIFLLLKKPVVPGPGSNTGTETSTGDKVKVEFYVMSQCPYGTQVENAIMSVLENMGDAIDFQLNYIASETSPGQFQSLHGDKEVVGDIVQLCAKSYYPKNYQYMKFVVCQNKDASNIDTNWQTCAQENGMDVSTLQKCMTSDEGKNLLRTSIQRAGVRKAQGSPTMFIQDVSYQGQRDSLSFQRAICKFSNSKACANIAKCASDTDCTEQPTKDGYCINPGQPNAACEYKDPVEVDYVVLNSAKCGSACDPTSIVQVSQQLFLGAKPRLVDINSTEGQELIQKYNITVVPAYIFDSSIEQSKTWIERTDLQTAFEKVSDKYKILDEVTGSKYFVSDAQRKAYYDSLGITIDPNKPQIDFFVMAFCPYGNQAEEAIAPVYNLLKNKAVFKPHYVIYANYSGGGTDYCMADGTLCSMHGIQEVHQDARELCVNKYMGITAWFNFAVAINNACTAANVDSCWKAVAQNLSLDVSKIQTCQDQEAVDLLTAEKALDAKFGATGSPSVYINGDSYGGARTPEGYKEGMCSQFTAPPAECNTNLTGATAATAATVTGGCG